MRVYRLDQGLHVTVIFLNLQVRPEMYFCRLVQIWTRFFFPTGFLGKRGRPLPVRNGPSYGELRARPGQHYDDGLPAAHDAREANQDATFEPTDKAYVDPRTPQLHRRMLGGALRRHSRLQSPIGYWDGCLV